jgi:HAD superfamily hydrolase (TIGR01484 family)
MVVTDLDGTLLHSGSELSRTDLQTLTDLGSSGMLRVIATGRSLYSAYRVLQPETPIDYLIFSSGAGILEWSSRSIVRKHSMTAREVEGAATLLLKMNMEFMIHEPIPDNHHFHYFGTGHENPDFIRRLDIYRDFAMRGDPANHVYREACQIVAIEPHDGVRSDSLYGKVSQALEGQTVIRTTSPIDGASTWIEIFPRIVSKSQAAEWIRCMNDLPMDSVLAVGNDYNDIDLLTWAPHRYVVDNAPAPLKHRFLSVRSSRECGFTDAVQRWQSL